jgi:hypothetical protein
MIRTPLVLGAACALAGCAQRSALPHATGVARAALSVTPARLDTAQLRLHGCETP